MLHMHFIYAITHIQTQINKFPSMPQEMRNRKTDNETWHKTSLLLRQHLFNSLFSRTTWVSRHQKGKPFWILLEQQMMGWQWHQLDCMQIICTSLQTDNHASTKPSSFFTDQMPFLLPNQQRQSTESRHKTSLDNQQELSSSWDGSPWPQ